MPAPKLPKREFLMLAHKYAPKHRHKLGGWLMSEKLDGVRAMWDGGVSRGRSTLEVPWANTQRDRKEREATGLWTRGGKPIYAPKWFLDRLPPWPLDGELWAGRGKFQQTLSTTRREDYPHEEWTKINYMVFASPNYSELFATGRIYTNNWQTEFDWNIIKKFLGDAQDLGTTTYREQYERLMQWATSHEGFVCHDQIPVVSDETIEEYLSVVIEHGGEGLILRHPSKPWEPRRSHWMLKYKPYHDDEGIVVGYTTGKITDKGSRLHGMMGALVVKWRGRTFELSGLNDQERTLDTPQAHDWACDHPGEMLPDWYNSKLFPRGSKVTFRYRDVTNAGLPKEAKYWRKHEDQ